MIDPSATHPAAVDRNKRKPTVFRRIITYLEDQALEYSTSKPSLTPPGREPQQRRPTRDNEPASTLQDFRNLSTTTTAVDHHRRIPPTHTIYPNTGMASRGTPLAHDIRRVQYANEKLLQSYEVYIPEHASQSATSDRLWIIYIHGGYFRDWKIDATSFRPALELLTASSPTIIEESKPESESDSHQSENGNLDFFATRHRIAGFASINYRLSPHADYPQDPDTTLRYELRDAKWPEHIDDVIAALRHLQSRYNFGSQYILSGHSVGAQLAFLAALRAKDAGIATPRCVIGCNGIYDFPEIHQTNPEYEAITRGAMTPEQYEQASPARHSVQDYANLTAQGLTAFVLSHSKDDGLVVWDQVEIMKKVLDAANASGGAEFKVKLVETHGAHDVIWEKGEQLAMVLKEGLDMATT